MSTLTVPTGFSYVLAALVATIPLHIWQTMTVSKHRRLSGIKYPRLYADNAEMAASPAAVRFNCVQRAHQNTLENISHLYVGTVVLGLKYPYVAAAALGAWIVNRIIYTRGYASGDPAKRSSILGMLFYMPAMLAIVPGSMYTVYQFISEGL
ncbi:hypothetical protein FB45DRAFT_918813 [Roridomyces roridus]|uniref:Membrane-associated proteins in eicosanoid and glutathione metabolism n=1 Tax=Roridomyces roridus TaxID=1738132 RepID=A0AAD7BR99_9AGAR|nr:hypothetical protein FB45DRAFT_918813 [Roridomyces roridus]